MMDVYTFRLIMHLMTLLAVLFAGPVSVYVYKRMQEDKPVLTPKLDIYAQTVDQDDPKQSNDKEVESEWRIL